VPPVEIGDGARHRGDILGTSDRLFDHMQDVIISKEDRIDAVAACLDANIL
jgi:hypothetical protein